MTRDELKGGFEARLRAWASESNDWLAPATRGAASELLVCADLMLKGFSVYRNQSPNGGADLIAKHDAHIFTVQVKTREHKVVRSVQALAEGCNVLAVVDRDTLQIKYFDAVTGKGTEDSKNGLPKLLAQALFPKQNASASREGQNATSD